MIALKTECQDADMSLTCKLYEAAHFIAHKLLQCLILTGKIHSEMKDFEFFMLNIIWKNTLFIIGSKQIYFTVVTTDLVKLHNVLRSNSN